MRQAQPHSGSRVPRLTLLLGGARSGKSALAVRWGLAHTGTVVFVATAEGRDGEMRDRIARHRSERPPDWTTVETAADPAGAVAAAPAEAMVIVDCLTLWVANVFDSASDHDVVSDARRIGAAAAGRPGPTVVVSNDVGLGIVPAAPATRRYRDLLGTVNTAVANCAAHVLFVAAGQVLPLQRPPQVVPSDATGWVASL